jgi:hypothetical protein
MNGPWKESRDACFPSPDEVGRLRCTVEVSLIVLLGLAVTLLPNPRFFFHDDIQHQYLPVYYEIGKALRAGNVLLMDLPGTWFGGDLISEYQYAIFNPIALAVYAALPSFDSLLFASAFLAAVWYLILGAGSYVCARRLGARHAESLLCVTLITTNPFVSYWFASAWLPGLVSIAWAPWVLWALAKPAKSPGTNSLAIGATCYLLVTAGWPHALLACLVIFGCHLAWALPGRHALREYLVFTALPAVCGVLLAAPAWLPILLSAPHTGRISRISNTDDFLVAPLTAILNAGFPTHIDFLNTFGGYHHTAAPYFFLAPFALLFPLLWRKGVLQAMFANPMTGPMIAGTAIFVALSLGPSHLGPFRWPFRFVPYAFMLASFVLALGARAEMESNRRRSIAAVALCVLSGFLAWQKAPSCHFEHTVSLGIVLTTLAAALYLVHIGRQDRLALAMMAITFVSIAFIHSRFPSNDNLPDWRTPDRVSSHRPPSQVGPDDLVLFVSGPAAPNAVGGPDMYSGNVHLFAGIKAVNGYSPTIPIGLGRTYCMSVYGAVCDDVTAALTGDAPGLGASPAVLAGITRVVVARSRSRVVRELEASTVFRECGSAASTVTFCRDRAPSENPLVSWTTSSIDVSDVQLDRRGGTATLRNVSPTGGRVIFRAPWRPGATARYLWTDGKSESMSLRTHTFGLVSVDVPPRFDGQISIVRELPYKPAAMAAIATGAILLLALSGAPVLRRRVAGAKA